MPLQHCSYLLAKLNRHFFTYQLVEFPVEAYHLKFEELKCDPNIYKWSVRVLEISRSKRHLDKASVLHFWDTLDR